MAELQFETNTQMNGHDQLTCRRPYTPGEVVGAACGACGHINLLHPGGGNPAVEACLVCCLEKTLDDFAALAAAIFEKQGTVWHSEQGKSETPEETGHDEPGT